MSLVSVAKYWDYEETLVNISQQLHQKVTKDNLQKHIQTALDQSEFDDARMYLDIAESEQYPLDYKKLRSEIESKDTQLKRIATQVSNFTNGFIKGKSNNMAGIAGSISADFTVVGDARDLYQQYNQYEKGEEVNELIVLLSGAGIGLTALTVGTMGSAAPAKAGASVIKVAAKTQRITTRFQKLLIKHGRKVFDWKAFTRLTKQNKSIRNIQDAAKKAYHPEAIQPLKAIAKRVNSVRKSSSTVDAIHLLKYVETSDDLRRLEKFTAKHGTKSKGFLKLLGKGAIASVRILKRTRALILSLISSFISAIASLVLFILRRTI